MKPFLPSKSSRNSDAIFRYSFLPSFFVLELPAAAAGGNLEDLVKVGRHVRSDDRVFDVNGLRSFEGAAQRGWGPLSGWVMRKTS